MNKKANIGTSEIIIIVLMFFGVTIPFFFLQIHDGTIIIERPYKTEYNICSNKLDECQEAKIPLCPKVECKGTPTGTMLFIISLIVYLGTLVYAFKTKDKLDKREEELINRENRRRKKP